MRPGWRGHAAAIAGVIFGWVAREALTPVVGPSALPFLFFFPGIAAAAWYGGLGAAALAVGLSALTATWSFLAPLHTLTIQDPNGRAALFGFLGLSTLLVSGIEVTRRARARLLTEIAERRRAEMALRESEAWFRLMADAAPVLMWVSGVDKLCTWFNKGWLDFVGRPLDRELGNGWAENVHPDDLTRCLRVYVTAFDAREPFSMTYRLRRADGEYRWILDHGVPRFAAGGAFAGYIGSCVDITERKQAEDALTESDRRKDEFLAVLSHELRNPLAPIRMAVAMLNRLGPPEPEPQRLRDIIDRQTVQLTRLLDDLLDVSRIQSGRISLREERASVERAVAVAVEALQSQVDAKHQILSVSSPGAPVDVLGDPGRLSQVFANLLDNASKYTANGGRITLTVERAGGDAIVRVRDSGIGIAADQLGRVFEMFVQIDRSVGRDQGGLGVGLSLARRLVELHRGRISATSGGLGQGSEFTVRLPALTSPAPDAVASAASTVQAAPSARKVLVADDNVDSAEVLATALRRAGHHVATAHNGPAAVATAAAFQPDIALLDIGMPGLNGYEVAGRLRAARGDGIRLVAITGWGQDEDKRLAREAGFDRHLTKPVDLTALYQLVSE